MASVTRLPLVARVAVDGFLKSGFLDFIGLIRIHIFGGWIIWTFPFPNLGGNIVFAGIYSGFFPFSEKFPRNS